MPPQATPAAPSAPESRRHARRKTLLMLLLPFIVGVEFMENGMFVFSASHIAGGIDAAPREFAHTLAAYGIGSALMIVMQQWLARHFGYRRYLCGALALFAAGALACSASGTLAEMTLARLLQGFGGGALFTSGRVLVPLLFGAADRPRALRYFMLVLFGMVAGSPLLAAVLVEQWSWRWIFVAIVPFAALAIAGCWGLLPAGAGRGGEPVRWAAGPLLLFAAAITLVQFGLSEAQYDIFSNPLHLVLLAAAGTALLAGFLMHQWGHDEPLLRLRELRHPAFAMGLVLYFMHYCLSNAASYAFPILAERGLGLPLATTGLLNTFAALVTWAAAWGYIKVGSRLPRKKPIMIVGAGAMAVSALIFALLPPGAPAAALLPALAAKGVFGALLVLPVAGLTFRDLGDARFAHGYQSKNLMRQLAGSFATSVAAIALQNREFTRHAQIAAAVGTDRQGWLDGAQAALVARGMAPEPAHEAALETLAGLVDQQALLMACNDLYRLLAALAALTVLVLLVQRRFR